MSKLEIRNDIDALEKAMRNHPNAITGDSPLLPLKHTFGDGLYLRDLTIPKNTLVVGKVHRYRTLNILLKGEITVLTEDGVKRLTAPQYFLSPAGSKKVGYTHKETVWLNVHATEETDLKRIEAEQIMKENPYISVEFEENKILELALSKEKIL